MSTVEIVAAWLVLVGLAGLLVAAVTWLILILTEDIRRWVEARRDSRRRLKRETERLQREASDSVLRIQAAYCQAREELRRHSSDERR